MTEQRRPLSSPQVAQLIGRSVRTVQRMAESGDLRALKMEGQTGAYIFDEDEVDRWRAQQSQQATA